MYTHKYNAPIPVDLWVSHVLFSIIATTHFAPSREFYNRECSLQWCALIFHPDVNDLTLHIRSENGCHIITFIDFLGIFDMLKQHLLPSSR